MPTVEWKPGLDPVTSMAAHPSMQSKTIAEIERLLAEFQRHLRDSETMPDCEARDEYVDSLRNSIAAYELALDWRK